MSDEDDDRGDDLTETLDDTIRRTFGPGDGDDGDDPPREDPETQEFNG